MPAHVGPAGAAAMFGVDLPAAAVAPLAIDLSAELAAAALFPETLPTLQALRSAGFKLALCFNLAAPYAVPVTLLLPALYAYARSFEVGAVKPDPLIYQILCRQLDCALQEVMMIGDHLEADHTAPPPPPGYPRLPSEPRGRKPAYGEHPHH